MFRKIIPVLFLTLLMLFFEQIYKLYVKYFLSVVYNLLFFNILCFYAELLVNATI